MLRRDPRVLWRRSGSRVVLLPRHASAPMVLDGVARVVWELLDEPAARNELTTVLSEHFERPLEDVDRELGPFLDELIDSGAIADAR